MMTHLAALIAWMAGLWWIFLIAVFVLAVPMIVVNVRLYDSFEDGRAARGHIVLANAVTILYMVSVCCLVLSCIAFLLRLL